MKNRKILTMSVLKLFFLNSIDKFFLESYLFNFTLTEHD
jgi:hypothetical protein